jgi:hypothetical protein
MYKNSFSNIRRIGGSGDRGRDIIANKRKNIMQAIDKDELWIAVCKRYITRPPSPSDLKDDFAWFKVHKPHGILIFTPNKITPDTNDWIEAQQQDIPFNVIDIDYLENELLKDTSLKNRFFPIDKSKITDKWYDSLIGPRTHNLMIYTAGEMPEETDRNAKAKWRFKLEKAVELLSLDVGFFHPEFIGCDHRGINAGETVSMDAHMVQKSDAIIAYLNNEELLGTIIEVMLAHSQNKRIAIFIHEKILYEISDDGHDIIKLYKQVYKTKHLCPCILYADNPDFLVRNKYWFLLTYLKITNKNIIIMIVNDNDFIEKMVSIIKNWI